jgi:hypothetical protein
MDSGEKKKMGNTNYTNCTNFKGKEEKRFWNHGLTQRGTAATKTDGTTDFTDYTDLGKEEKEDILDHELHELHEYTFLSVIPAKAGIHLRTTSYEDMFLKITTEIHVFEKE